MYKSLFFLLFLPSIALAEEVDLVGENIIESKKVLQAVKDAERAGKVVVVYTDAGIHEDIVSLGVATNKKTGEEGVILTGQFGLHPAVYGGGAFASKVDTREDWVKRNTRYDAKIDAFVIVSKEKVEQLEGYTTQCTREQRPYFISTCWSYAETTWNDWLAMAEPKKRTTTCKSVNENYSGSCSGLKFVCSSRYCKPSASDYKTCVKKLNYEINQCMHSNMGCINSKEDCTKHFVPPIDPKFLKKKTTKSPAAPISKEQSKPVLNKKQDPPKKKAKAIGSVEQACLDLYGGEEALNAGEEYTSLLRGFCGCLSRELSSNQAAANQAVKYFSVFRNSDGNIAALYNHMSDQQTSEALGNALESCAKELERQMPQLIDQ